MRRVKRLFHFISFFDMPSKQTAEEIEARDAARLNQLGYKQELKRELTSLGNYGIALSVICISSGLTSLFACKCFLLQTHIQS
ncbi:hypothetical protein BJV82DRAFT_198927 [Fennellomyces sp. T-0311]|nr:hypothetical protein BJV82DRAFT_198927 [Fennellomyces sp. T-0311]